MPEHRRIGVPYGAGDGRSPIRLLRRSGIRLLGSARHLAGPAQSVVWRYGGMEVWETRLLPHFHTPIRPHRTSRAMFWNQPCPVGLLAADGSVTVRFDRAPLPRL